MAAADIEIRAAEDGDLEAIHDLECAAFPAPWRLELFAGELQQSGRLNLVALRGRRLVGYVFAMWIFDEMHINKIAVVESERRRGVALALMERCLEHARANAVETLSLEVRASNEGAQAFYRTLGFVGARIRPRYYPDGEAAVVMTREIAATPPGSR